MFGKQDLSDGEGKLNRGTFDRPSFLSSILRLDCFPYKFPQTSMLTCNDTESLKNSRALCQSAW